MLKKKCTEPHVWKSGPYSALWALMAARCGRADVGEQPEEGNDDCTTCDGAVLKDAEVKQMFADRGD